jgi:hypothetical protein
VRRRKKERREQRKGGTKEERKECLFVSYAVTGLFDANEDKDKEEEEEEDGKLGKGKERKEKGDRGLIVLAVTTYILYLLYLCYQYHVFVRRVRLFLHFHQSTCRPVCFFPVTLPYIYYLITCFFSSLHICVIVIGGTCVVRLL